MLPPSAFTLPLESDLKLRVIEDEVKECTNIDELKKQLIALVKLNFHYQQMLSTVLKQVIEKEIQDLIEEKKQ